MEDRERLIKKARALVAKPADIKAGFKQGGRSYVVVDVDTESARLDEALITEQTLFDGIHVIETSLQAPASEVVKIYKNLWRIEESFRHMKSSFQSRPVYVRLPDHVRGQFLIGSSRFYVNGDFQRPDLRIAVPRFMSIHGFRFIPGRAAFIFKKKKYSISLKP